MDSEKAYEKLAPQKVEPNKSTHKKIGNMVDEDNPTIHRIPSAAASSPKRTRLDENHPQNDDCSFVTPYKTRVWTPEVEEFLLKAPIKEVTYSPFFYGPRYKFTSLFDSLEENSYEVTLMSDVISEFVVPKQPKMPRMPKPRKARNRTCVICGEYATMDYMVQACSHRLHNNCKKERDARRKYRCPICY